jgi:hypothetical protein
MIGTRCEREVDRADEGPLTKKRKRGRQAKSCVACHRRKQKVRDDVIGHLEPFIAEITRRESYKTPTQKTSRRSRSHLSKDELVQLESS